jgi:hypothetical protein
MGTVLKHARETKKNCIQLQHLIYNLCFGDICRSMTASINLISIFIKCILFVFQLKTKLIGALDSVSEGVKDIDQASGMIGLVDGLTKDSDSVSDNARVC